jgi:hypothetical protein
VRVAFLSAALFAAAAVAAASAPASIEVAVDPRGGASLRVDATGNAEVRWTAADGTHRSLLVGRDGSLRYGGLSGSDVSHPAAGVSIPWTVAVRQTPDGRFYALQAWRRLVHGPVELRFSRWEGAPTKLTLRTVCCKWGHENVVGSASFHGRPIYGYKSTRQGNPLDPYGRNVYLDSYRGGRWERMMGILTNRPAGSFSLWIRPEWAGGGYRGTIPGPNWGWTLGPDAFAQAGSSQSSPALAQKAAGVPVKTAGRATEKQASAPAQDAVTGRAAGVGARAGARSTVQVTLSATPDPATVGSPLTYTATVTNTHMECGLSSAQGLVAPLFARGGFGGGSASAVVDVCVATHMRGLVPHDRVCEMRSGADLSGRAWPVEAARSVPSGRPSRRCADALSPPSRCWRRLLHRRERPEVPGELTGDGDDND